MNSIPDRPIAVIYKTRKIHSLQEMTTTLLETVSLKDRLPEDKHSFIALKPNLVVSKPADRGATTHPEICEGIVEYLKSYGYENIGIIEGSWVGGNTDKAYKICGYEKFAQRMGVKLINTQKDEPITVDTDGYSLKLCEIMQKVDFLINIPVLKGHCQTHYTGALKNLKGCIPDSEKRRFHSVGLHEPIARLNTIIKQDFIVMDGICGDPTYEEGGSPSSLNRILCCNDPVLLDSYAASLINLHYSDIPYITRSAELGVGSLWEGDGNHILELNNPDLENPVLRDESLERIVKRVDEQDACSSCYAALVGALRSMKDSGNTNFAIGRAFKKKSSSRNFPESCVGIGQCTAAFTRYVPGCPPTSEEIGKLISSKK